MKGLEFRNRLTVIINKAARWLQENDPSVDIGSLGYGEIAERLVRVVTIPPNQKAAIGIVVRYGLPVSCEIGVEVTTSPRETRSFQARVEPLEDTLPFSVETNRLQDGNLAKLQAAVAKDSPRTEEMTIRIDDLNYMQCEGPAVSGYVGASVSYNEKGEAINGDLIIEPGFDHNIIFPLDETRSIVTRYYNPDGTTRDYLHQMSADEFKGIEMPATPVIGEQNISFPVNFRDIGGNKVSCQPTFPRRVDIDFLFSPIRGFLVSSSDR